MADFGEDCMLVKASLLYILLATHALFRRDHSFKYLNSSASLSKDTYPFDSSSLRSFSILASNRFAASSLASDPVRAFNRLSISACCSLNASARFRVASAWSLEAFVAFDSASCASASYTKIIR